MRRLHDLVHSPETMHGTTNHRINPHELSNNSQHGNHRTAIYFASFLYHLIEKNVLKVIITHDPYEL